MTQRLRVHGNVAEKSVDKDDGGVIFEHHTAARRGHDHSILSNNNHSFGGLRFTWSTTSIGHDAVTGTAIAVDAAAVGAAAAAAAAASSNS